MLELEGLVIEQDAFRLAAPSVTVGTGRIAALIGPSGGGKSTLLSVIAGFFPAVAGRVVWQGAELTGTPPADRPVAMIFQDNNLLPHLTAFENAALGLRPSLRLTADQAARAEAALARVGLAGLGARRPGALSGGQQGRVALARLILQDRPLWLLDEPFAALGPALRREMLMLVRNMGREAGATVLLVTHQPEDAELIADEVILVAEGSVAAPVATAEIMADPPAALADYLGR